MTARPSRCPPDFPLRCHRRRRRRSRFVWARISQRPPPRWLIAPARRPPAPCVGRPVRTIASRGCPGGSSTRARPVRGVPSIASTRPRAPSGSSVPWAWSRSSSIRRSSRAARPPRDARSTYVRQLWVRVRRLWVDLAGRVVRPRRRPGARSSTPAAWRPSLFRP